jgi:hypothetical protein
MLNAALRMRERARHCKQSSDVVKALQQQLTACIGEDKACDSAHATCLKTIIQL